MVESIPRALTDRLTLLSIDGSKLLDFVNAFLNETENDSEKDALVGIIRDTQHLSDLTTLTSKQALLLNMLFERNIGIKILPANIKTLWQHAKHVMFASLGLVFLLSVTVFLFSAVLEGHSGNELFSSAPIVASIIFVGLICLLYLLEGTQISITTLRLKDLEYLKKTDPSSYNFQKKYKYLSTVNEYLAGRQLFTIFCVFTISQIATFPDLDRVPFTQIVFSTWVDKWLATPLLDLGFLGAIFTLWIGQLTPQFLAGKQPISFIRNPLAKWAVNASTLINKLGVSVVPSLFASKFQSEPEIPTSHKEKLTSFQEAMGYVGLGINLCWHIKKGQVKFSRVEEVEFFTERVDVLKVIQAVPNEYKAQNLKSTFRVNRSGAHIDVDVIGRDEYEEFESLFILSRLSPRHGGFISGDVLSSELYIDGPAGSQITHLVRPSLPTRYMSVEILVDGEVGIRSPVLLLSKPEHFAEGASNETELVMSQSNTKEGQTRFHYFLIFPDNDATYKVAWTLH